MQQNFSKHWIPLLIQLHDHRLHDTLKLPFCHILGIINYIKSDGIHVILEVYVYMYVLKSHSYVMLHWALEVLD
jgi:hypothetical protein